MARLRPPARLAAGAVTGLGSLSNTIFFLAVENTCDTTAWNATGPVQVTSPGHGETNGTRVASAVLSSSVDGLIQLNDLGPPSVASISETMPATPSPAPS